MAGQTVKSGFAAKVGAKAGSSIAKHAGDAKKLPGGGELPDGIEHGIGRLIDCRFDLFKDGDNKGEYFFLVAATVLAPKVKVVDGVEVRIEGKRFQTIEPVCDTPKSESRKTMDDHIAWVMNQMRLLGYDTKPLAKEKDPVKLAALLEAAAASLKAAKPTFSFRTWKGKKQTTGKYAGKEPRVNVTWGDACKYNPAASDDGVKDNSSTVPVEDHGAIVEEEADEETTTAEAEAGEATEVSLPEDLDELLEVANRDDDSNEMKLAQIALNNRALELGVEQSDIDNTNSWDDVAELIRNNIPEEEVEGEVEGEEAAEEETVEEIDYTALGAEADEGSQEAGDALSEAGAACDPPIDANDFVTWAAYAEAIIAAQAPQEEEAETEAEEEEWVPGVGDIYYYKPAKAPKAVECEVMAVDADKRLVSLKNGVDKKTIYKGVSWDALSEGQ